jgi:hypothetical protein
MNLSELSQHLEELSQIFHLPFPLIHFHHIHQCQKSLEFVKKYCSEELPKFTQWKQGLEARNKVAQHIHKIQNIETHIQTYKARQDHNIIENQSWVSLEDTKKQILLDCYHNLIPGEFAHFFPEYLLAHQISSYLDYDDLLIENIERAHLVPLLESHAEELELKYKDVLERIKIVEKGFKFSLVLCIFIIPTPLCLPFSWTLWKRKKKLEKDISHFQEKIRQQNLKLLASQESLVILDEVKHLTSCKTKDTLLQKIKDLKEIYTFSDPRFCQEMEFLKKIYECKEFLNLPKDSTLWVDILKNKMSKIHKLLNDTKDNEEQINKLKNSQSLLLKDHSLNDWQNNLRSLDEFLKTNNPLFPLDDELIQETYDFLNTLSSLYEESHAQLKLIQQGKHPDTKVWQSLNHRFQGSCHIVKSIVHYLVTLYHQYPWSNHSFL